MASDRTEFAVGDIERLFEEARRNTKAKHEKWEKYYDRRRRDVQIKVSDWVLIETHPLSSATRKVVAKFKPKFEGPYRVLDVKIKNVVIWKEGKRLTINVDQVRIYRHRKYDETVTNLYETFPLIFLCVFFGEYKFAFISNQLQKDERDMQNR
ncbi:uncharacterized protein TNCV_1195951 [Trichonephila clavipes]|uniref:Uncharacterized protein n=1 Tax=Trichonephila clavipes TaxID=2585209 RepID=A0A8X6VF65_TRICX|nr:uncharacterized protein TNCV_1195951 [Trichonephila clavipes]